jgi:CRISPR/Cas system type I-B associated protein Csh2 (Cas7 group RAMP superfamily)
LIKLIEDVNLTNDIKERLAELGKEAIEQTGNCIFQDVDTDTLAYVLYFKLEEGVENGK